MGTYSKQSHIKMEMEMNRKDSKFQLEIEKEKHKELINQNVSAVDEITRVNKLENRNFKNFLNIQYIDPKKA